MNDMDRREDGVSGRDFGRLEAEVKMLQLQNVEFKISHQRMNDKLDVLVTAITEAKGGWKMLLAVGSASAIIATAITKSVIWIKGG